MATYTDFGNLELPGKGESYDVDVHVRNYTVIANMLKNRPETVAGKGFSTNDFTNTLKKKLENLSNYDDSTIKKIIAELEEELNTNIEELQTKDTEHETNITQNTQLIKELQEENALLKSQIPVGQASGENITVNDSSNLAVEKFGVSGNSKQETRSGRNLYNVHDVINCENGYTVDENEDWITHTATNDTTGVIYRNYHTRPNKSLSTETTYYVVTEIKEVSGTGNVVIVSTYEQSNSQFDRSIKYSFADLENNTVYINKIVTKSSFDASENMFRTFTSYNAGESGSITFRISLLEVEPDANAFEYEKFGAMPSIEYSSPIQAVENPNIIISNKNLIDFTKVSFVGSACKRQNTTSNSVEFIPVHTWSVFYICFENLKKNTDYCVSGIYEETIADNAKVGFGVMGGNTTSVKEAVSLGANLLTLTKNAPQTSKVVFNTANHDYIFIRMWSNYGATAYTEGTSLVRLSNVQLEEGTIKTDFEPSETQNFAITTQQQMFQGDGFEKVDGNWKEKHNFGCVSTFGSENITVTMSTTSTETFFRYIVGLGAVDRKSGITQLKIKCSHFKNVDSRWQKKEGICGWENTTSFCIGTYNANLDTAVKMKTFLQENDVEVWYELAEPVYLDCTPEQVQQLEALEKARTYKNVTHFYSTDTIKPVMDVTYSKDLEILFNNISQAILSN